MQFQHQLKNRFTRNSYEFTFLFLMILFTALTKPSMLFDQFIWAEMATNYFKNAHLGFFEQLMVTDFGYLQFMQRLISYIGHILQIPISNIPYFYNWSSLFLIFLILVPFISNRYEVIVKEKLLRLAIILVIFAIADFESINFISFSYFSLFLMLIESIRLYWTRRIIWYDYLLPFLFLSKPILLIFYPIFFILLCFTRNKEFFIIFLLSSLLVILQIYTAIEYIGNPALSNLNNAIEINSDKFFSTFILLFASLSKIILYGFIHNLYLALILGFLIVIFLFKNLNQQNRINLLIILIVTFSGILFNLLVLSNWQQLDEIFDRRFFRQNIFIYMNFILLIGIIVSNIKSFKFFSNIKFIQKTKPSSLFILVLIISLLFPMHLIENAFKINKTHLSGSNEWGNIIYQDNLEYCHSINPSRWVFTNTNCRLYQDSLLSEQRLSKHFSKDKVNNIKIAVQADSIPNQLFGFGITVKVDESKTIYKKSKISCDLSIFDNDNNLLVNSSKIFKFRSGKGIIEFNYPPIPLNSTDYVFELTCNKHFYYDSPQGYQANCFMLGKS